jgi:hypothetical protein
LYLGALSHPFLNGITYVLSSAISIMPYSCSFSSSS